MKSKVQYYNKPTVYLQKFHLEAIKALYTERILFLCSSWKNESEGKLRNSQSSTASEGYNGPNIYWLKYLSLLLNTYLDSHSGPEKITSAPAHQYLTWFCCHAIRCWVETKHSYRHSLSHTDVNTLVLDIRHYCVMKISLSGPVGMGWHLEFLRGHQHTKGPDPKPRISPYLCLIRQ